MPPSPDLEPSPADAASARRARSDAQARVVYRAVPCIRCREPLYYPSPSSSGRRSILGCSRCGARTRVPAVHPRLRRWMLAAVYFVALAAIVFVCLHKG